MPLLETLTIALGTSVAKYLVKELLPKGWQDEIAADVVGAGIGWLTTKQPDDPVAAVIGQRIKVVSDHSRLPENDKQAVGAEVARTLATANTTLPHLVALDLDSRRLHRQLVDSRPEATRDFSTNATDLYHQMLRVAAEGIVETADQHNGFVRVYLAQLLSRQTAQQEQLEARAVDVHQMFQGIACWLREPEERAAKFLRKYQTHLSEQLDRMEPFGIPRRDEIGQKLRLRNAFIGLRVRYRSYQQMLNLLLGSSGRGGLRLEQFQELIADSQTLESDVRETARQLMQLLTASSGARLQHFTAEQSSNTLLQLSGRLQRLPQPEGDWRQVFNKLAHDESTIRDLPFEETFAGERRIMLEGKAGTGKSSLLQWLAVKAAQNDFPASMAGWNGVIPFFIRLRSCRDGEFPPPEGWLVLEAKTIAGTMPAQWVHDQLDSGRALVLIDGVDEMPKKQRAVLLDELKNLVRNYPLARYVVSSRPTTVNEKQWPEWRNWLREEAFAEVILQEMDAPQLNDFVDHWHEAYAEYAENTGDAETRESALRNVPRLRLLLGQRDDLRKLAQTPLLAAMICTLYQERGDNIPRERLQLYRECIQMLLERREQKKDVNLADDYITLSEGEKISLLRALAYWMLENELTTADAGEAAVVLERHLPRLSQATIHSGRDVLDLFVERVGLLQEEVVGEISFRHRSFQEYLAADAANYESNIRALVAKSHNDQWRETIILAFGMANRRDQGLLLRGIIAKGQKLKTESQRRQRLLLALACLETGVEVDPELRQEVLDANQALFPPHSAEEAEMISKAGAMAVDLLHYDSECPATIAAHSIRALAAIGGDAALEAIAGYMASEKPIIRRAIADSWESFDRQTFADRILSSSTAWSFSRLPAHPRWPDSLTHVEELELETGRGDDLLSLAILQRLTSLSLSLRGKAAIDLHPLAKLSGLRSLKLTVWESSAVDLNSLANLTQLTSLELWTPGGAAVDLRSLAELTQLTSLSVSLRGDFASDLSPLATLTELTSLTLTTWGRPAGDLSPLAALQHLTSLELTLYGNVTIDLLPLAALSQLTSLTLTLVESPTIDLSWLSSLPQLTSLQLWLERDAIADLGPLAGLSQLNQLWLSLGGSASGDLIPLASLSQLTTLGISLRVQTIVDLQPLASISKLTSLSLDLQSIVDIDLTPLADLSQLITLELDLGGKRVIDLRPLASLSQLGSLLLALSGGAVVDLHQLTNLSRLTTLTLGSDTTLDLRPLANLSQITSLGLSLVGDATVDLHPLASLSRLASLAIPENLDPKLLPLLRLTPRRHSLTMFETKSHSIYYMDDTTHLELSSRKITYLPARGQRGES